MPTHRLTHLSTVTKESPVLSVDRARLPWQRTAVGKPVRVRKGSSTAFSLRSIPHRVTAALCLVAIFELAEVSTALQIVFKIEVVEYRTS